MLNDVACHCVTMKRPSSAAGHGTLTSPNYPRLYSPTINCVLYSIVADDDRQIVELQFVDFSMAPPVRNRSCTPTNDYWAEGGAKFPAVGSCESTYDEGV